MSNHYSFSLQICELFHEGMFFFDRPTLDSCNHMCVVTWNEICLGHSWIFLETYQLHTDLHLEMRCVQTCILSVLFRFTTMGLILFRTRSCRERKTFRTIAIRSLLMFREITLSRVCIRALLMSTHISFLRILSRFVGSLTIAKNACSVIACSILVMLVCAKVFVHSKFYL